MSSGLTIQEQRDNAAATIAALEAAAAIGSAQSIPYLFQVQDFGAGDAAEVIRGPAGLTGRIVSFTVYNITEIFEDGTARLDVGDGSDQNGYAFSGALGTEGTGGSVSPAISPGVLDNSLPPDTDVTLTFVAPSGSPTGIADALVVINWS